MSTPSLPMCTPSSNPKNLQDRDRVLDAEDGTPRLSVLEKEVVEAEDSIVQVDHQHNAYSPIANLPHEVLIEIFSCIVWSLKKGNEVPWFSFSWVCRRWRTLALTSPILWVRPDWSYRPEVVDEMLLRTGDIPLHFQMSRKSRPYGFSVLYRAVRFQERLKELVILSHPEPLSFLTIEDPLEKLNNLPIATRLVIQLADWFPRARRTLKIIHAPRLRTLHIINCGFDLTDHSLHALVSLEIRFPPPPSCLPASKMIDVLRGMPNLCKLRIEQCMPSRDEEVAQATRSPLQLQRVRKLILSVDRPSWCISFLANTQFPSLSTSTIRSIDINGDLETFCDLVQHRLPPSTSKDVSLSINNGIVATLKWYRADSTLEREFQFLSRPVYAMFISPLLSSTSTLRLDFNVTDDALMWTQTAFVHLLSKASNLCELCITSRMDVLAVFVALGNLRERHVRNAPDGTRWSLQKINITIMDRYPLFEWDEGVTHILRIWNDSGHTLDSLVISLKGKYLGDLHIPQDNIKALVGEFLIN